MNRIQLGELIDMTYNTAHRGFSGKYPENTMLAFRKAIEIGADGIELDVHLSRDAEVVIIHDENLRRVAGRAGFVKDLTAAELGRIDVSVGHPISQGFNAVPTLREYFEFMRDKPQFTNIELKNTQFAYEGLEEKTVALMREYGLEDRVLFSSFNHGSMVKVKCMSPESKCAFLTSSHVYRAGEYARRSGVDCINPHYFSLNDESIAEMHGQGIGIQAWTVDDTAVMEYLMGKGILSVITNRPDLMNGVLGRG